jgi:ABC-type multidrug transport system fused ATPase/permease subunit
LLSHAASHWAHLLGILMLGLLWSPMALLAPLPLKIAVDSAVGAQPLPAFFGAVLPDPVELSIGPIGIAAGLAVALAVVGQAQGFVESLLRTYTAEHLTLRLRSSLFCHAQHLSLAYHDRTGSFDSTHRILSDAPCIQWATIYGTIPVLTAAITLTSMVYVTALIDWQLAVVALAISPAIFLLSRVHCRFVRSRWDRSRELEGATMSVVQEVLSVLRVVKAFGRERQETDRFAARSRQVIGANLRIAAINGGFDLGAERRGGPRDGRPPRPGRGPDARRPASGDRLRVADPRSGPHDQQQSVLAAGRLRQRPARVRDPGSTGRRDRAARRTPASSGRRSRRVPRRLLQLRGVPLGAP